MAAMRKESLQAQVRATLDHIEHLPPIPEGMVSLWRIIDEPDTTLDALVQVVSSDPSLAMSLLRLVNSANFALPRKITSVREAVHFLGFGEVKNLSIAIVVKTGLLLRTPQTRAFDRLRFWRHCVGSALCAQLLARALHPTQAEDAFTAALVHDIGWIVLDQAVPEDLMKVLAVLRAQPWTIEEAERRLLGVTHVEAGCWLGEAWQFPDRLLIPMEHHLLPGAALAHRELCALVHVAHVLSLETAPFAEFRRPPELDPRALALLRGDTAILDRVRRDLAREVDRVSALLEIRI